MNRQAAGIYDNAFYHDNVYGHALALLLQNRGQTSTGHIHLDIGCGYGRIAESIAAELGVTYVGVDGDEVGLESLRSRGFEAHPILLDAEDKTFDALQRITDDRPIASISMLDSLEHLAEGDATLRAVSRLAAMHSALVVVSVPNVTHADIGFKLAFGRWDYTEAGLLDHTHLRLFGSDSLDRVLRCAGLFPVDTKDVILPESDQLFPRDHPALARGTELNAFLSRLRTSAAEGADVLQFVRLCAPGRPIRGVSFARPSAEPPRPFLSVVVRTQGRRPHTFVEALTSLAGQTDTDFEVIVVGHRLSLEDQTRIERAIEDCPEWLRLKCRLLLVKDGNRTRPLNDGFAAAQGRYIAILDDDDIPFGHWVETFRLLHHRSPGRLLRAATVRQDVTNIAVAGLPGLRATGKPERIYPASFDLFEHLRTNHTPPVSVAFPRGAFHDLGLRFDESLTTTEDWDYIMRVASIVGTVSSPEVTSVYRWWPTDESSRTVHKQEEWARNHRYILAKMDEAPLLCPPGTTQRLRILLDAYDQLQAKVEAGPEMALERMALLQDVNDILESTCWLVSKPLRVLGQLLGKSAPNYSNLSHYSTQQLADAARSLRQSTSWRLTAPLRRLRHRLAQVQTTS